MKMTMKMKTPFKYLQAFLRARCRSCLTPMALGLGMEPAHTEYSRKNSFEEMLSDIEKN